MGKTDCRAATAQLETFLKTPGARRVEIAAALEHLRECPACKRRIGQLGRLLEAEKPDEDDLTCEDFEELLPGFLTAERLEHGATSEWLRARRHLAACPHCATAYASLAQLAAWGVAESGIEPSRIPEPDLSFLRSTGLPAVEVTSTQEQRELASEGVLPAILGSEQQIQRRPAPAPWQQATQGVYRLAAAIPVLIGQAAAAFGVLVAPLAVQLAPTPVYRRKGPLAPADEARDFIELLALPHPETNVTLKVSLGPVFEGRGSLALAVSTIEPPLPIAQARVILRDADGVLLEGAFTGDDGAVLFRDLDAGGYLVQVEHGGQAWEVPLSFAAA